MGLLERGGMDPLKGEPDPILVYVALESTFEGYVFSGMFETPLDAKTAEPMGAVEEWAIMPGRAPRALRRWEFEDINAGWVECSPARYGG